MSRVDPIRRRIGTRLRDRRRALGMTQQECAGLLGVSRLTLTRIELGYRRIRLAELASICETVGCSAEELLGDAALAVAAARNHARLDAAAAGSPTANSLPVFSHYYQAEQARQAPLGSVVPASASR